MRLSRDLPGPSTAPFPWSISEIARGVSAGELSASDLVRASHEAVDLLEERVGAWVAMRREDALRAALKLDDRFERHGSLGTLHGVPVGIKDIFDTADLPTEWGTKTQEGRQPDRDCALVTALKSRGCVVIGKTVTTAFAYFDTGPTRNPANLDHTPGGSSSGSAAAVAAGMVPLAVGSQTQGSVLRPASFCGVTGFKPGFGVLPLEGVMPFAPSLDHAGLFTATPGGMRLVWRALGFEARSAAADSVTTLPWPPIGSVTPAMREAVESALAALEAAGVAVQRERRPSFFDDLPPALFTVMAKEAAQVHGRLYREHGRRVGTKLANLLDEGMRIPDGDYRAALNTLKACRTSYARWAVDHPIVATPSAPGPALRGLESSGDPCCNAPFTALGAPAVSVPMPVPENQLPMGLQLTSTSAGEAALLASAEAWHRLLHRSYGGPCR
ncbi:MAG: amidase [Bryobacterales bacterium]|nr:amidase [Bryobacterales bacterium]